MIEARHRRPGKRRRERASAQAALREAEAAARRSALVTLRLGARLGHGANQVARRLGLSRRTLFEWTGRRERDTGPRVRGRPTARLPRTLRQEVLAFLSVLGPRVSLATLRATFPKARPAALEDLRTRYRLVFQRRNRWVIRALRWTKPGWVWALDFTDAPAAIDAAYPKILLIRDLSSGRQLVALPTAHATARFVRRVLEALFRCLGPPLVLKSDNDGPFREEELRAFVRGLGVLWLYSPPSTPAYNGACEAGVGSIKTRAHHEAARHDRPCEWTCDDVEAARCQANETARPWGHCGPTPDEAFAGRRRVSEQERHAFHLAYGRFELAEREARDISETAELDFWLQTSIDRAALGRALREQGILVYRRRRISQPFNSHSRANNT
jgi:hypothetical protein